MKAARENFDSLSTKEKTLILADLRVESWSPPQIDSDSQEAAADFPKWPKWNSGICHCRCGSRLEMTVRQLGTDMLKQ